MLLQGFLTIAIPHYLPASLLLLPPHGPMDLTSRATRVCPPPSAHNFHRHVAKRLLRWLDAWRGTLKSVPLHASSHLNVLLSMFRLGRYHPTFLIHASHRHHVPTRTMKWFVACTRTPVSVLVYATSHFRVCLFIFVFVSGRSRSPYNSLSPCSHSCPCSCGYHYHSPI